jgi:hypothetical protein
VKLRMPAWVYGTSAYCTTGFPRAAGVTARAHVQFGNAHPHAHPTEHSLRPDAQQMDQGNN